MSTELHWFKSSYSGGQGGECIEVAITPATIHIRDSKNPPTAALQVSHDSWSVFLASLA